MEGWAELFKHFLSSRLSSACLLITSTTFQFGPKYSDLVPALPEGWKWVGFGVMIFTAAQCTWWLVLGTLDALHRVLPDDPPKILKLSQLSVDERLLLSLVANYDYVTIQDIPTAVPFSDPLAANVSANLLVHRELLDRSFSGRVTLTARGEAFVMRNRSELPPV